MFLMGPLRQLSKMFEKGRIVATLVYLVFMALTLFCAIKVRSHVCAMTQAFLACATEQQIILLACPLKYSSMYVAHIYSAAPQKRMISCSCDSHAARRSVLRFRAMQLQSLILTLLCFIIQLLAMVWYSLSFIVSSLTPTTSCHLSWHILLSNPQAEAQH